MAPHSADFTKPWTCLLLILNSHKLPARLPRPKSTMKCERFLTIPVSAVFLLMGFVYYITIFVFMEDWVGLQSSAGSLNSLIFSFLSFLCLFSFFSCVLIDPGRVPASYIPDVEESWGSDKETDKNVSVLCLHE